jgi:FlaA1/EpsC-like NDP-sugar epimerase
MVPVYVLLVMAVLYAIAVILIISHILTVMLVTSIANQTMAHVSVVIRYDLLAYFALHVNRIIWELIVYMAQHNIALNQILYMTLGHVMELILV